MARRYRVVHERLSLWKAIVEGRPTRDAYVAQSGHWWGWRAIDRFATAAEAEQACRDHAGGTLLPGGGRVVAEFERPD